jgi:hypothetical protein
MNHSYTNWREVLVPEVERSEEQFRRALGELQIAVERKFDLGERIAERPMPWLVGGVLLGLWLAARRNST